MGDSDPHCSASSLQRFDGEDLGYTDRVKQQKAQMSRWISESIAEKEAKEAAKRAEEAAYHTFTTQVEEIREQTEMEMQQQKDQAAAEVFAVNAALMQRRREEAAYQKEQEATEREREVKLMSESKFLNEDPSQSVSAANPRRYRVDHYKVGGFQYSLSHNCRHHTSFIINFSFITIITFFAC